VRQKTFLAFESWWRGGDHRHDAPLYKPLLIAKCAVVELPGSAGPTHLKAAYGFILDFRLAMIHACDDVRGCLIASISEKIASKTIIQKTNLEVMANGTWVFNTRQEQGSCHAAEWVLVFYIRRMIC
jgi:hypothetical protein